MRLSGSRFIRAPRELVWAFIMTPDQLRECLPGCERFEATGPDSFAATMRLGVAFLKGTYSGTILVPSQEFPERLQLVVKGSGALGSLTASGTVTFMDSAGGTFLAYDGEAAVSGRVAIVGEGVISATADRLVDLFMGCVASHVED